MSPDPTSLDRLHDVIAPPPVPWWPPAPGWYWVLGIGAVLVVIALVRGFLRWQRNRYRREALAEWRRQVALLRDPAQRVAALAGLSELLKRTALTAFPREQVAALTGAPWLAFLDRTTESQAFTTGAGEVLEKAAYDPRTVTALEEPRAFEAASLVQRWITDHRVGGAG